MEYRSESYLQFILKKSLPPIFKFTLPIGLILMVLLSYFTTFESNPKGFWGTLIFLTVGGSVMFTFITGITYFIYSKGNKAYETLKKTSTNLSIISDVDISISNFDRFSSYNKSPTALLSNTLYDFRRADLIISDFSLILLGKANFTGNMAYALPIEITNSLGKTGMPVANIQSWKKQGDKLLVEILDHNYGKPIKLIIRSNLDEIENWYIRYKNKAISSHYDY